MQMKTKKYLPIIYTATLSVILFGAILFLRGFYPFGNGSVMLTDMYDECVPSLYRFYDIMHGYKNIFYEFQASGGLNLYTETINEVCNPFNYLLLFWKRENIYLAVNILLMLYVVGAACTSHFFLSYMWGESKNLNTLLSMCYAFSGYMAYNFQILRWMILPVIFPVFMLACIRLWKEQKGALYAVLLAYQIVLSVQHGYMTLLFCLFASGIWMYCIETKSTRKKMCLNVGIYTFFGMALSAVMLLPTIFTLTHSSRSGANASYLAVFEQHGLKDLFERLFQICHPLLVGMLLIIIYKLVKGYQLKECLKNNNTCFYAVLNVFLIFTVFLQPANLLWHMGSYVCFPVRYGYMLVFMLVCLIRTLKEVNVENERDKCCFKDIIKKIIAIVFILTAIALLKSNEDKIVEGFLSLTISKNYLKETCIVIGILLSLFVASLLSLGKNILSRISLAGVLVACSFCYFYMISLPESFRDTQEIAYQNMIAEYVKPETDEFLQLLEREPHNPDYPRNASLMNGKSSMSGYFPTAEATYQYALGNLGYLTPWVSTIDVGGTKISEYFFNNVVFLPVENAEIRFEEEMPLENHKKILNALFDGKADLQGDAFEIICGENLILADTGKMEIVLCEESTIYIETEALYRNLDVFVNDQEISLPMVNMQDDPHVILCLGTFLPGKVCIEIYDDQGEEYSPESIKIGVLNENKWEQLTKTNNVVSNAFRVNSKGFTCNISAVDNFKEGVVVLPINATEGWKLVVDDSERSLRKIGGCFVGVPLENGQHEVELQFIPPHFKTGCVISLTALVGLIVLCLMKGYAGFFSDLDGIAEVIFQIVFWGAIAGIYVIPAIGLFAHLTRRVLYMIL